MKKLMAIGLAMCMSIVFKSCENPKENVFKESEVLTNIDPTELDDFKGLPVRHRFSTPLEFLEEKQDYASIKALYNTKLETAALRNGRVHNGAQELPSIEIIAGVVENVLSEFPYDNSENSDAADLGFEMIVDDFPTLTHEEIEENMDLIDEYYTQNLDYLVFTQIAEDENLQELIEGANMEARTGYYKIICVFISTINEGYSASKTAYALYNSNNADTDAKNSVFGDQEGSNDQQDAYRHLLFSSYLARYYYTKSSKSKRLQFSKVVGNFNESCSDNIYIDSKEMDVHNNWIGRKLFNDNCSYKKFWGMTYGLNKPSIGSLKAKAETLVLNGTFIDKNGENLTREQTQEEILNTAENTVVYFE